MYILLSMQLRRNVLHYIFSNFPNRVPKPTSYLTGNAKSLEFEWSIQLNSNILGMFKEGSYRTCFGDIVPRYMRAGLVG